MQIERIVCGAWSALTDVSHGATCISLRNKEYDAVLLREPKIWGETDNPFLYGMPVLFPVNRIEGGCFEFENRSYKFPVNEPKTGCHLHGKLYKRKFELIEKSENRISCVYSSELENYLDFPHKFTVTTEHELKDDGFYQTVTVKNLSELNMPVFIGFHTTFNTLFAKGSCLEDIRVSAEISEEYERNADTYLPTGRKMPFDAVSRDLNSGNFKPCALLSRHYRAGGSGKMSITDVKRGIRMVYENSANLGFRLIYSGDCSEYICLEPQSCLAGCQNSPFPRSENGFDFIEANSSKTYNSRIYLEEL